MSVTINGSSGVTTPGISNSEGYTGDGLTIAAGAPSGAVQVDASGNVGIGVTSMAQKLQVNGRAIIGSYASTGAYGLYFRSDAGSTHYNWQISTQNTVNGGFEIARSDAVGSGTFNSPSMVIDSSGYLLVGTTSTFGGRFSLSVNPGVNDGLVTRPSSNNNYFPAAFQNSSATFIGSIGCSTTTTSYNTSSNYRLKENIQPMTGALSKVAALKPCTYKWKADGSDGEGFIAHELAEVVPQCVTGEKDAVEVVDVKDEDGNVIGTEERPVYQGIDTSFLVATLTAAIQELKAQVDAQAVEIAALKGQA